jgi:putative membrane-bound dehydrogenase-like protein
LSLLLALPAFGAPKPEENRDLLKGVKAPPEFQVTLFAAPPDVGYPTCLAAVPSGEVFVGVDENGSLDAKPSRGRVVRCVDTDGDGRADRFNVFAEMDSPRGIVFDHGTLYVMHPPLLEAFIDDDGDGKADRSEVLVRGLGFDLKFRGADHTVNGMRLGIDGFLYIAVGDYGAVRAEGKDGSQLQLHGGGIVRVRPDGSGLELVSRGQRNIYDVAVSPELDLFTRDNTNDGGGWDVRLSHVILSGHYGYPSLFKNFPDEILAPLADYGGGSPCGSLFLDEPGFPPDLGRALYTCEWGRSIVYRHPLEPKGAGFTAGQAVFVQIPRPTDMDADGLGHLYVSSWSNGSFTYSGPNVGFVVRLALRTNTPAVAFPDLAKLTESGLVDELASSSAVRRLHAQREILRRGRKPGVTRAVERLASSEGPLGVRVAALFTLSQLAGPDRAAGLARLAKLAPLREFALRALADERADSANVPAGLFVDGLQDTNPRVRLQAVTALGRMHRAESAESLLALVTDADPLVSHAAGQALITLHAVDVCLASLDSPGRAASVPGAMRVLQAFPEEKVVQGLLQRLARSRATDDPNRRPIVRTLCRLYQREAEWDGKWWGTRPDTSGPYFKPVKWEASERIAETLRHELEGAGAEDLRWLVLELQRNKVDLPELTALVLKLADQDPSFRSVAVEALAGRSAVPEEALPLLGAVASSAREPAALRARAVRALQKVGTRDDRSSATAAREAVLHAFETWGDQLPDELAGAWEEFARDPRHGRDVAFFVQLAADAQPARRRTGYGVLLNLSNRRFATRETKEQATRTLEQAWSATESTVSLLQAITWLRADQFAHQIRALAADRRPEVSRVAGLAAARLGLKDKPESVDHAALIESLPYEAVVAQAAKEPGEARAGRELFVKQGCVACHTVSAEEPPKGPFLGGISTRYNRAELCESILKPGAKIAQGFETQWFSTQDGEEVEGFVVREAGDEVEVRNIQGITTTLPKKMIKERGKRDTSVMPPGLADKLTPGQLASILAYLESLKQ